MTTQDIKYDDNFNVIEYREYYNEHLIVFQRLDKSGKTIHYERYDCERNVWIFREFIDLERTCFLEYDDNEFYCLDSKKYYRYNRLKCGQWEMCYFNEYKQSISCINAEVLGAMNDWSVRHIY